jgi:hypothetical protein
MNFVPGKAPHARNQIMYDLQNRLSQAADAIDSVQKRVNGLGECDRKLVTYYILATYGLNYVQTFPLLVFKGAMATGKSCTLRVTGWFARRPNHFSLRGRTLPTIRDELVKCDNGTAIIEEADAAFRDNDGQFERLLSDRYDRSTAEIALKVPAGGHIWKQLRKKCFGATVLHRRLAFADPALDGRSIFVHFRSNPGRAYEHLTLDNEEVQYGRALLEGLEFEFSDIPPVPGIEGRVLDTFRPILSVACMCEDWRFWEQLVERMELETVQIKDAQSTEPVAIVLRALIEKLGEEGRFNFHKTIKIRELAELVWSNHRIPLKPQQVAKTLREIGLETRISHGVTVVVPTPATLIAACNECGYEEDSIVTLRRNLVKKK